MTPIGTPRLHLRSTSSTNDVARELALAGAPHGLLVTASSQTAGRGRHGRSWSAPTGQALLMSILLERAPGLVTLRAAVATAAACGASAQIKWPNDVLLDGRKVAGILCEGRAGSEWVIVGIGVNVAIQIAEMPAEIAETVGTLGRAPSQIERFLPVVLRELDAALALPQDQLIDRWRERDALAGRPVRWDGGSGVATGIDRDGRLIVTLEGGGEVALEAGEVTLASVA